MGKGLTPVIATVLLMTISVGATASAYFFLTELQNQAQDNAEERISEQQRESQAGVNIEFVTNSSDGYMVMNLRNTGAVSLKLRENGNDIMNVLVQGRLQDWKFLGSDTGTTDFTLNPSQTKRVNTTSTFPSPSNSKTIALTGQYGTEDTKTCFNSGTPTC